MPPSFPDDAVFSAPDLGLVGQNHSRSDLGDG